VVVSLHGDAGTLERKIAQRKHQGAGGGVPCARIARQSSNAGWGGRVLCRISGHLGRPPWPIDRGAWDGENPGVGA